MASTRYTEAQVAQFFNGDGDIYRTFWDPNGSMHWGYWPPDRGVNQEEFLEACVNLNHEMARSARLSGSSFILDLGCGNGNTALWLAREYQVRGIGIDISQHLITNANQAREHESPGIQASINFYQGSATNLQLLDQAFTHVWCQATLHRIPNIDQAIREVARVLAPGGTFVCDTMITGPEPLSQQARRHCFDRLLCDPAPSQEEFREMLQKEGFQVTEWRDLSWHLEQTYRVLRERAIAARDQAPEQLDGIINAYQEMANAIRDRQIGWAMFLARASSQ